MTGTSSVRKRITASKNPAKSSILLTAECEKLWKQLKDKLKYSTDTRFLLFLLDLGEREFFWRRRGKRRKRKNNAEDTSESCEETEPARKKCRFSYSSRSEYRVSNDKNKWKRKKIVAVKFKYLGDRSYEVSGPLNHKSLTDVSDYSSGDERKNRKKLLVDRSVNTDPTEVFYPRLPSSIGKQLDHVLKRGPLNLMISRCNIPRLDASPLRTTNGVCREYLDEQTGELIKVYIENGKDNCKAGSLEVRTEEDYLRDFGVSNTISINPNASYRLSDERGISTHERLPNVNCGAQHPDLAQFDERSNSQFAGFQEQPILSRFVSHGNSELMAVLENQGPESNQYDSFGENANVSSALTGYGGDPNLNSAFVHYSGKLLSSDDSMLVHFDGEQNIEPSSEYPHFGVKSFGVQPTNEIFLSNSDHVEGSAFLHFDGKSNPGIDSMAIGDSDDFEASHPVQTSVPRLELPTSDSPLPRFGEEGSVKTKFPSYRGKIINVELPRNVLEGCDEEELESQSLETLQNVVDPRSNRMQLNVDVITKDTRNSVVRKEPQKALNKEPSLSSQETSNGQRHTANDTIAMSNTKPLKSSALVGDSDEIGSHSETESEAPEFGPFLDLNSDNFELVEPKTPLFCSKFHDFIPPDKSSKNNLKSSIYSEGKGKVAKKPRRQKQPSFLPRFLGKTGSELMSVKFKSHLLAESLLGHAPSSEPFNSTSQDSILSLTQKADGQDLEKTKGLTTVEASQVDELSAKKYGTAEKLDVIMAPSESDESVPPDIQLKIVDPEHGLSVVCKVDIPIGREFGPLQGFVIAEKDIPDDCDMRGIWQVGPESTPKYVSTRDPKQSNWLRHIRPAKRAGESNCLTVMIGGELFFRTKQTVSEGEELLYWTVDNSSKGLKKRLGRTNCGGCNLTFSNPLFFRMHCLIFHGPESRLNIRKYYCKICGHPFIGRDSIVEHALSTHEGKGAYQCIYCSKFFLKGKSLEHHKNYGCSSNPRRTKPQCDVCGQTFCQPQKLVTHKRRMHSCLEEVLKEFQCEHCKKILGTNAALIRHKKEVHTKEHADTCDRCGKVFPNKTNLKVHMLTHSGIKPFKCGTEGCSARYTSKQGLQAHYKRAHGLSGDSIPKIERTIEYTFDAYCGTPKKENDCKADKPTIAESPEVEDDPPEASYSEATSPLSVGCSLDAPLNCVQPCSYESDVTKQNTYGSGTESDEDSVHEKRNVTCDSKEVKRWLSRNENSTAGFLVDEAISAVEKDIGNDTELAAYDNLRAYGSSPPLEVPREFLRSNHTYPRDAPRDYNISSLIREHLPEEEVDPKTQVHDAHKEISDERSRLYREDSREDFGDYRRTDLYRRDGYDLSYNADRNLEAQNLCLKEKGLQLDLSYKGYDGFDELNRDNTGLEGILASEQCPRPLPGLSPRYHPSYDAESVDLSLPRLPYPQSPIYPALELPNRFDLTSGISLLDFRSHIGLSPHRFSGARIVGNGGSSPTPGGYPVYQPQYTAPAPSGRHSPTPTFHPYSAYY